MSLFRFAASDAHPAPNVNPTADPTVSVNPSACHEPNSHVTSSALNDRVPAVACEPPQNSSSCWNGVIVNSKNKTNYNVSCLFCSHTFNGTTARVRAHFVGGGNCGVKKCTSRDVPENFVECLKSELRKVQQDSADKAKRRKLAELFAQTTLPNIHSGNEVRNAISEFFLAEALPFSKVESPYFLKMVTALTNFGKGVSIPVRQTLATTLTDSKYIEIANMVANATIDKEPSSLICDGWKNTCGDPVMAYLQVWDDLSIYRKSFNNKGERRTGIEICEQAELVTAEIGEEKVCQFISDSGSDCKRGRALYCEKHPHVLDVNCSCHCLDLLCSDIYKDVPSAKRKFVSTFFPFASASLFQSTSCIES